MAIKPIEILINAKDNASSVFDSLQGKVAAVGTAIAAYFGVSAFVGVVEGAADLEAGMSRVQAATGASAEEMERLKKAAEDAGANTKFTSTEAAAALENLAKAGLSAGDAIETLPAVLALAQAGDIELATSAEYVTKAVMGMGLQFSDAGRVADVLAKGANATNTSVEGLAQALSYAAPTANSLGVSLEATVAIIGKFADAGIDASRAGTALNSIMSQFSDPASKFRKELGAIGITTGDFETALKQLAESGARGSQAINAVGLEAGPALKALLNQGMPALQQLIAELKSAGGSADATSKVMSDNLKGSMTGLASAWDTVKNVLGTPVLPVLKDAVDQLAGAFRSAVSDGTIAKFGEAIAAGFQAGIKWAKEFLAQMDFTQLAADLRAFADRAGEAFDKVGEYARNAGDIVKTAYGVMSAGTNAVLTAIYGIGSGFAEVAVVITQGVAKLRDGLATVTFGGLSDSFKLAAEDARLAAEGFAQAAQAMRDKAAGAFEDTASSAQLARDGFTGLTSAATAAAPAVTAAAAAQVQANKEMEAGAAAAAAYGVAQQKKATADDVAKQAADGSRAAVAQLREEYDALVASGSLQGAAEKLQEINQALLGTAPAAKDAARAAADAASAIDAAFKGLGVTSNAELVALAATAKTQYEVIKNAGTTTASDISAAFKVAAEKAIAANNGIAPSWVLAQAGAAGYRTEVDAAGKTSVKSMADAAKAVDGAAGAHTRATGAVGTHTSAVRELASSYTDAGAKALEAQGNFMAAALAEKNAKTAANSITKRPESPSQGVWTKSAIIEYLKQAGLDAKLSEDLSKQFTNANGSVDYEASAAQKKWGGEYGSLSDALSKMSEYYKYDDSGKFEAEQRIKFLNQKDAPAALPATGSGRASGAGTTVNITVEGTTRSINTDAQGAATLQELVRQLAQAKGTASVR